jgi:S-formylglutathione hydrolase FrmB
MGRDIPVTVITPDGYAQAKTARYPVVYALHGAGGNNVAYSDKAKPLGMLADRCQVVIVFPDGGRTSWWLDSPIDPAYQYETFVAKELVAFVDRTYRTEARREKRAIVGGSMGGHGACYVGIRNKAVFGAVGNIFGGVDLRPFPDNWDIKLRIGSQQEHSENWERFSVVNNLGDLKDGELAIITMVGSNDFFLQVNRDFNALLQKQGIRHYYIEAKGAHDVPFQNEAFGVMFRFFDHYFKTGQGAL